MAQTFVGTIDVSEKSRINYWTFDVEEAGLGGMTSLPGGAGMKELRHAAEEIVAVKADRSADPGKGGAGRDGLAVFFGFKRQSLQGGIV